MKKTTYFTLMAFVGMTIVSGSLFGCKVTIKNDTTEKLTISDKNTGKLIELPKGKTKTFGDMQTSSNFEIYSKAPKARTSEFIGTFTQKMCASEAVMTFNASEFFNKSNHVQTYFYYVSPVSPNMPISQAPVFYADQPIYMEDATRPTYTKPMYQEDATNPMYQQTPMEETATDVYRRTSGAAY